MLKTKLIILLAAAFFISSIIDSYADIIYLKNKRQMEGIIKNETNEEVTLDIGAGTLSVKKNDIERIEKSGEAENKKILKAWQNQYMETGRWVASGGQDMLAALQAVKGKRIDVVRSGRESQAMQNEIDNNRKELMGVYEKSADLNSRLKQMSKGSDPFVYNNLVAEVNATSAEIGKLTQVIRNNEGLKKGLDLKFSAYMQDYMNAMASFEGSFNDKYAVLKKQGLREEDENFYKWIQEEIAKLEGEFERKEINFSKQKGGIVVGAVLNDKVMASLVVDTGASLVVISKRIAEQLGANKSEESGKIELVLADGRKITATPVVLSTVDVGGSKVKDVMAAVIEEPPDPGVDGLLGMSFLSNFFVKIDANGNSLVLEKFNPR